MKFLLGFLVLIAVCQWVVAVNSEPIIVDDFDVDEEMLFAKYQSLIAATMAGKDLNDEDLSPDSINDLFLVVEAAPNEMILEPVSTTNDHISKFSGQLTEQPNDHVTISVNSEIIMEKEKIVDTFSQEEILASNSAQEINRNELAADNFTTHSATVNESEQESVDGIKIINVFHHLPENYTQINEDSTDISTLESPTNCSIENFSRIPSVFNDNAIREVANKLESYENSSSLIPSLVFILSELELIFRKNPEQSYLASLKIIHQDEISVAQEDLSSCKDQMEMAISQQYKSEQQRDLAEIRLKKCRNDITVTKVTNEQQILAIEESKVELEFRLKETQRENARLRVTLEDMKRNKLQDQMQQHQRICDCTHISGLSLTGGQIPLVTSKNEHVITPLSSTTLENGNIQNALKVTTRENEADIGLSLSSSSETIRYHVDHSSNNSIIPEELSIGRFLKFEIPIWFRRQFSPYLLSFVAWEYRLLFVSFNFFLGLIDPRVWGSMHQMLIIPCRKYIDVFLAQYFSKVAISQYLGNNPWISSIMSQFYSTIQRYLVIFNNPTSAISEENGHVLSYYETIIETVIVDIHEVTVTLVETISSSPQIKILFGRESYFFVELAVVLSFILLVILYRKVLLGMAVLLIFVIFFPILLLLLLLSSVVGAFMPKRRKVIKKKAQRSDR